MWTWLAYITLSISILLIVGEFVGLYILSARSESRTNAQRNAEEEVDRRLASIVSSPTVRSREEEVHSLRDYIRQDRTKMDILSGKLLGLLEEEDGGRNNPVRSEMRQQAFYSVYTAVRPTDFYAAMLHDGNIYDQAFACRRLSEYFAQAETSAIRKLSASKNKELAYSAAITLSVLGDEEGLLNAVLRFEENREMSHRIIVEIIEKYSGDLISLSKKLMEQGDEYIRVSVMKALAKYKVEQFEDTYLEYLRNGTDNAKIAALRALAAIAKPRHETDFIEASLHGNWTVRSSAIKAMVRIPSDNVFRAISHALNDPEWWVRYNAAKTLVAMDREFSHIEPILQGDDPFASDAVKHALYQVYYKDPQVKVS